MTTHELKTWPEFFEKVISGEKTFELRKDDRGFRAGDVLHLREWSPRTKEYTGRELSVTVTYLLGGFGLEAGWVAMGFAPTHLLNSMNAAVRIVKAAVAWRRDWIDGHPNQDDVDEPFSEVTVNDIELSAAVDELIAKS